MCQWEQRFEVDKKRTSLTARVPDCSAGGVGARMLNIGVYS
jgi:hypothetical protein